MSTRYTWRKYSIKTTQTVTTGYSAIELSALAAKGTAGDTCAVNTNGIYYATGDTATVTTTNRVDAHKRRFCYYAGDTYYCSDTSSRELLWVLRDNTDNYTLTLEYLPNSSNPTLITYYLVTGISGTTTSAGDFIGAVSSSSKIYPDNGISGNNWYTYYGSDIIDPSSVTYSTNSPVAGSSITIKAAKIAASYGGTIYYLFSYSTNGGSSWTNIGSRTTATSVSVTIPSSATQFRGRVVASDGWGFTSTTYVTGSNLTVSKPSTLHTLSLQVRPSGAGTISGAGKYEEGTEIPVRAIANSGYTFSYWEDAAGNHTDPGLVGPSFTLIMPDLDITLTAVFTSNYRTLSLSVEPPGAGTVTGAGKYQDGDEVPIQAIANSGYVFSHWKTSDNDIVEEAGASVTVFINLYDIALIAVFVPENSGTYVGVSNKARSISKMYVGVNGKAREVIAGYVGVNGKARKFM